MFLDDHPIDCKIHVGVRSHQSQLTTSDALHVGMRHPTSPCSLICAKPEETTCCYDRMSNNTVDGSEIRRDNHLGCKKKPSYIMG